MILISDLHQKSQIVNPYSLFKTFIKLSFCLHQSSLNNNFLLDELYTIIFQLIKDTTRHCFLCFGMGLVIEFPVALLYQLKGLWISLETNEYPDLLSFFQRGIEFVKTANKFESEISVEKNNESVNGKSIMGMMMLAAGKDTVITLTATGSDAEEAMQELEKVINNKFGEE